MQKHSAFTKETKYRGENRSYGLVGRPYTIDKSMDFPWSIHGRWIIITMRWRKIEREILEELMRFSSMSQKGDEKLSKNLKWQPIIKQSLVCI